jgi:hypothetical protein
VLLSASIAVQVTVVIPIGKEAPDAGRQVGVIVVQSSVTVEEKLIMAEH